MFLTEPQSRHYRPEMFESQPPTANHFDWELFYRFKDERERFWLRRVDGDSAFKSLVAGHFAAFNRSIDTTVALLERTPKPRVLDVGLSSEQIDRSLIARAGAELTVLDVQREAADSYARSFGHNGRFVLGDVISYASDEARCGQFDLVYSVGLIEHFPDKSDILGAHVRLAKRGGLVLLYVPVDSEDNRRLTSLCAEWENFGYRELLTPEELRRICESQELDVVAVEAVGFFAALWGRRRA